MMIKREFNNKMTTVIKDGTEFVFSYDQIVAVRCPDGELFVSVNEWGTTTGRHLNSIEPDKGKRLPFTEFMAKIEGWL
ncbi:MAG: hypothetical protein Q8N08_05685 [Methanobacteriaceae archaeon]|nr:hypothetical protein [Methanobacteriaceae archaeon]